MRFAGRGILGAFVLFLCFGAPVLIAWALGAGEMSPMAILVIPLGVMVGGLCWMIGDAILEQLRERD